MAVNWQMILDPTLHCSSPDSSRLRVGVPIIIPQCLGSLENSFLVGKEAFLEVVSEIRALLVRVASFIPSPHLSSTTPLGFCRGQRVPVGIDFSGGWWWLAGHRGC